MTMIETTDAAKLIDTVWRTDDLMESLHAFRELVARRDRAIDQLCLMDRFLVDAVCGMRKRQASWSVIAAELEISKQAAQQRYSRYCDE